MEVLLGPEVSTLEAGGALSALDAAIHEGDHAAIDTQRGAVDRALQHIDHEVSHPALSDGDTAQALSDAAYDLGLALLEGTPAPPESPVAMVADWRGQLDGLRDGLLMLTTFAQKDRRRLVASPHHIGAIEHLVQIHEAVANVSQSTELARRAALVRTTGLLGVEIRLLFANVEPPPRLPYAPRVPVADGGPSEPVHALTLPAPRRGLSLDEKLVEAGARLFNDARLSKDDQRTCATCHQPARYFTDAEARPESLNETALRNTPSLLYAPLSASQLWDGRVVTAAQQALRVIHSEAEMALPRGDIERKLQGDETYERLLAPFGGVTEENAAKALEAFQVARLVPADAPIDRYARGDDDALDEQAHLGLDVFAGPGRCTRCHIPPSFAGVRPRAFDTTVFAVVGVPVAHRASKLDPDRGRGAVTSRPADEHAFKTPTVRNVAKTAPYFHHGGYGTLEDVVELYDLGGPTAFHIEVPNLDPDVRKLDFTEGQEQWILHFMKVALLDESAPEDAFSGLPGGPTGGEFEAEGNR